MRFQSYFNTALTIIAGYDGAMPLSHHLKQFFSAHKKHGSTDRKMIAHACYSYYRLGHALKDQSPGERLKAALFLCTDDLEKWSVVFDGDWAAAKAQPEQMEQTKRGEGLRETWQQSKEHSADSEDILSGSEDRLMARTASVQDRYPSFSIEDIFPWKQELSEGIDHHAFCLSFLRQPDLFLRIRPGHEKAVLEKLVTHTFIPPFTLRLPNGFKVETLFTPDKEIVVQDYSSQRLAPFLQLSDPASPPYSVWDACAGSGGKSILAHDLNPKIKLAVSDIRESILHNLRQRFAAAGIKNYHAFVADLSLPGQPNTPGNPSHPKSPSMTPDTATPFDLIIADAPCTGSGTWSRTPEALYFFDPARIGPYRELQKKIVSNLIPHLAKGGRLVYSTCSAFKKENEEITRFIQETSGGRPDRIAVINGYEDRADSMFAARFIF